MSTQISPFSKPELEPYRPGDHTIYFQAVMKDGHMWYRLDNQFATGESIHVQADKVGTWERIKAFFKQGKIIEIISPAYRTVTNHDQTITVVERTYVKQQIYVRNSSNPEQFIQNLLFSIFQLQFSDPNNDLKYKEKKENNTISISIYDSHKEPVTRRIYSKVQITDPAEVAQRLFGC
jgi:hypothetical protein